MQTFSFSREFLFRRWKFSFSCNGRQWLSYPHLLLSALLVESTPDGVAHLLLVFFTYPATVSSRARHRLSILYQRDCLLSFSPAFPNCRTPLESSAKVLVRKRKVLCVILVFVFATTLDVTFIEDSVRIT